MGGAPPGSTRSSLIAREVALRESYIPLIASSVASFPSPPTSIVTTEGFRHPSILMISSTISVDSFLSHVSDPHSPRSPGDASRIESMIEEEVASAEFLSSDSSSCAIASISLSASM